MRAKLSLNLEDLTVDSFDTVAPRTEKGTVFGEQCTCYTNCTCPGCPSCDNTCPATCAYTCDDASCASDCASCASCEDTCDPQCYQLSLKNTNCNYACW